jgi:hypothetical protein
MKNRWMPFVVGTAVVLASPLLSAQGASGRGVDQPVSLDAAVQLQEAVRKGELADAILAARQTAAARDLGASLRSSLKQSLLSLPLERLEAFANAGGLGDIEAAVRESTGPKVLGATAADLVFTPVAPCRVVDTRNPPATILVATTQQSFLVRNAGGFASQGGSATDCGIPATATSVEMNFVAVGALGAGDLRAFAFGGTLPNASVINYSPVPGAPFLNIANGIAQPVCNPATTTCTKDITIQADGGNTHLVLDVVGYFSRVQNVPVYRVNTGTMPSLDIDTNPVGCPSPAYTPTVPERARVDSWISFQAAGGGNMGFFGRNVVSNDNGATFPVNLDVAAVSRATAIANEWAHVTNSATLDLNVGTSYVFGIQTGRITGATDAADSRCEVLVQISPR